MVHIPLAYKQISVYSADVEGRSSSVVEHTLGKGEAGSSILPCGTISLSENLSKHSNCKHVLFCRSCGEHDIVYEGVRYVMDKGGLLLHQTCAKRFAKPAVGCLP